MGVNGLGKGAVYYGYLGLVRGIFSDRFGLEDAFDHFGQFDMIFIGEGEDSPSHDDHYDTANIVSLLPEKDFNIALHLSHMEGFPNYSNEVLTQKMIRSKVMGIKGVLFTLFEERYGSDSSRIELLCEVAHYTALHVTYHVLFDEVTEGWYDGRIVQNIKEGDFIMLGGFGTGQDGKIIEKLPDSMLALQDMGVRIFGVSSYNPDEASPSTPNGLLDLLGRYVQNRDEALRLGLDLYQLTSEGFSAYAPPHPDANVLVDFSIFGL
jgi:hypothetical protein